MATALAPHAETLLERHYTRLAGNYDLFLKYSPDFIRRMTEKMIDKLRLMPADRFVDLGGGTGIYSVDILEQVALETPVLLVDPFEEMLAQAPDHPKLETLRDDALGFSERPLDYDKVLIKEAIHHVDEKRRLFENLYRRLSSGGRVLLVHIPPEIDYPLFRQALERSRSWHADPAALVRALEAAGFAVERDALEYRHALPKETYFSMVAGRYMSLLTSFTDAELEAGLTEMTKTYADREVLEYTDRFDFISGVKG